MPSLKMLSRFAPVLLCVVAWNASHAAADNPALQGAVTAAMSARRGTAVVMDVATGRLLASYRLEVAARRLAHPGSSIKPFTLLALLQSGKLDAQTALLCKRPLTISGHKLDCTHPDTHQPLDAATALAYSCNSYFSNVATRLSPAELRDAFLKDGFAGNTGLSGDEASGTVMLATSREQLQLQAIGEWGVSITPLELLRAYRNLAVLSQSPNPKLVAVFAGLGGSTAYGMGRMAQPDSGNRVAGKTGTSVAEEGNWTHAWFAGYTSAAKPEIVLVVFLEKGKGGADAAVIARQIFAAYGAGTQQNQPSPGTQP